MSQQQDLMNQLTERINILVSEVNVLTSIIENNVDNQTEVVQQYNILIEQYKSKEQQLRQAQEELHESLKQNLDCHIQKIQIDRDYINRILEESKIETKTGSLHPLYILCQEKTQVESNLRARLMELEKHNALLYSENSRLRSYIQHDKFFNQVENFHKISLQPTSHQKLSKSFVQSQNGEQIQQVSEFTDKIDYTYPNLNRYLESRNYVSDQKENINQEFQTAIDQKEEIFLIEHHINPIHISLNTESPQKTIQQKKIDSIKKVKKAAAIINAMKKPASKSATRK